MVTGGQSAMQRQVERPGRIMGKDDPGRIGNRKKPGRRLTRLEQDTPGLQRAAISTPARRGAYLAHRVKNGLINFLRLGK